MFIYRLRYFTLRETSPKSDSEFSSKERGCGYEWAAEWCTGKWEFTESEWKESGREWENNWDA